MDYFRMYRRFVIIYIKGKLEYHLSLLLELIANTILIGVYFAGFYVIFHNFNSIAGWNKYEVLFMFTTSWLSYSFSCFFFWSPMRDIGELIRSGRFDLYLTRPISPFVYLVLQQFQYTFLPRLFFSVFFWIYSLQNLQIKRTVIAVFHYCVSLLSAFAIFSAITVLTGTISFWTVKSEEIVSLLTDNKCIIVVDENLPLGIIANTAAILGNTIGMKRPDVVGNDMLDLEGNSHSHLFGS